MLVKILERNKKRRSMKARSTTVTNWNNKSKQVEVTGIIQVVTGNS